MDTLTTCLCDVVSDQEIDKQKTIALQKELCEVKSDQELCSMKLSESLPILQKILQEKLIERNKKYLTGLVLMTT